MFGFQLIFSLSLQLASCYQMVAIYPLIPKYDEKHELFIITSSNEVDSNWLRERLDMQHMKSYKTGKISKSNVIDIKDVRHALQDSNTKS